MILSYMTDKSVILLLYYIIYTCYTCKLDLNTKTNEKENNLYKITIELTVTETHDEWR